MNRFSAAKLWIVLSVGLAVVAQVRCESDEWDDLDLPVQPVTVKPTPIHDGPKLDMFAKSSTDSPKEQKPASRSLPYSLLTFFIGSLLVSLVGGRANAKRTLAFEECFCEEPNGLLRKHFTRLGKGDGKLLVNESPSSFKLHASGHQHLEAAVITLTLLRRHEMVSLVAQLLTRYEDVICMELFVKEESMPPMVLAVASPDTHKEIVRNQQDVKHLASKLEVKDDKIRDWPQEDLVVYAEHASYFYDMMTKPMLAQVFGREAFKKHKALFRGFQVTSEDNSSHPQVIRFWFKLPAAEQMRELQTLMTAALAMVNQVATYKVSPERQKNAEQVRIEYAKKIGRKEPSSFTKEVLESRKARKKK